jgi:hypothetical protein
MSTLLPPQRIQTFDLPEGNLEFVHYGVHRLVLNPHRSQPGMFQLEMWNTGPFINFTKESLYKILPVTPQGEITGEVVFFSAYPNSGNKILFKIQVIKNIWNGKFVGYSHNEPDIVGYFINQIKEGESIEIG